MNAISRGPALAPGPLVELINLRIVRPDFAICSVRLRDVHLRCIRARRRANGKVELTPPRILARNGEVDYGAAFALQPAARAAIERAICTIWAAAEASDGARQG